MTPPQLILYFFYQAEQELPLGYWERAQNLCNPRTLPEPETLKRGCIAVRTE